MNETKKIIPIFNISRSCNECTACCDGWLHGDAHGHKFYPGRKCHFVSDKGCTIYNDRPYNPCQTFKCEWLTNNNFPEWLKPNLSKVIFTNREFKGFKYVHAHEAGGKMDSEVLSWFIMAYVNGQFPNIVYNLNGGLNCLGQPEFLKVMFGGDEKIEVV